MKVALILVHYHTPDLLRKAVEAIRSDMLSSGIEGEIIIVDNGSGDRDKGLIGSLPARLLDPAVNLGYAGGINLGAGATNADIMIFMNPDVQVMPGSLGALVSVLCKGAPAAGPKFFLDPERIILLPPLMELKRRNELIWRTSALGEDWARWVRSMWRVHARRHWEAGDAFESYSLSGALLAVRRDTWNRVGPFDEAYKLYYEEADWLRRLEKNGLKSYYVPDAQAVHAYNRSAVKEPRAKKWFEESGRIFRKRYYGIVFDTFISYMIPLMRRLALHCGLGANGCSFPWCGVPTLEFSSMGMIRSLPLWVEISNNDLGIPAAAVRINDGGTRSWRFPRDIWMNMEPGTYNFRIVDGEGKEVESLRFYR
ncbi:MAG: glycosyltransferase family 2 protein [Candidatus Dadabacteria bacterium]|nr:glycosyltransferase family 2 protein [Candidatus Dadabacteria bacterium]